VFEEFSIHDFGEEDWFVRDKRGFSVILQGMIGEIEQFSNRVNI